MARYDVCINPDGDGYLLDVQADLLENLTTRIVVPLMPVTDAPDPAKRLNPIFEIEGRRVVMMTQFLAAVPMTILNNRVGSLSAQHDQIINALDMVFQGF